MTDSTTRHEIQRQDCVIVTLSLPDGPTLRTVYIPIIVTEYDMEDGWSVDGCPLMEWTDTADLLLEDIRALVFQRLKEHKGG